MCVKYLGCVLLACFPGLLHAQSATRLCSAPGLNGGYWVPEQDTYNHKAKLTYSCDNGRKPAVEGWWAKSTCEDGTWSPKPQCIDENACLPPSIPNAIYTVSTNGWYENKTRIRITCDKGYQDKQQDATAQCINGNWTSMPVCEKSVLACGAPPQIPHAVIILQGYQDVFAVDTELQYECEDGYSVDGSVTKTSIYCISGNWTKGPVCSKWDTGLAGSADVETGGRQTTSAGSETQPQGGASRAGTEHDRDSAGSGTSPAVEDSRPATGHDRGSAGSGTRPAGGGASTASSGTERDGRSQYTTVDHCGVRPQVAHGEVVREGRSFLRFQCNSFYTQVGDATVKCHNDGRWSQLPICKAAFCVMDPARFSFLTGLQSEATYLKEGEGKYFSCTSYYEYSYVRCIKGEIYWTPCCTSDYHTHGWCR
ncbi:complement factor H-like [Clinocottus analis]|uniref:complement factor H-like n=1 Tax=Clinocottus analis TaxID=304258 RepID=UPI0035C024ED